jgi:hypothetical protein
VDGKQIRKLLWRVCVCAFVWARIVHAGACALHFDACLRVAFLCVRAYACVNFRVRECSGTRACLRVCVCVCVCASACPCVCSSASLRTCVLVCVCVCMFNWVCSVYMTACTYVLLYACLDVRIYGHTVFSFALHILAGLAPSSKHRSMCTQHLHLPAALDFPPGHSTLNRVSGYRTT